MPEEREIDAAIGAVFEEVGVGAEVVVFAVFEYEQPRGFEELRAEKAVGEFAQFAEGIRWVGKDEVEALTTAVDEAQGIGTKWNNRLIAQRTEHLRKKAEMLAVTLHAHDTWTASGEEFQTDTPRTCEEVECRGLLKVEIGAEDVEKIFFRKVGRWTCLEIARHIEVSPFVFACDDAHRKEESLLGWI